MKRTINIHDKIPSRYVGPRFMLVAKVKRLIGKADPPCSQQAPRLLRINRGGGRGALHPGAKVGDFNCSSLLTEKSTPESISTSPRLLAAQPPGAFLLPVGRQETFSSLQSTSSTH